MAPKIKVSSKAGMMPGSVVYVGHDRTEDIRIRLADYTAEEYAETEGATVGQCLACRDRDSVTWIHVEGIHDSNVVQQLGDGFGIHPLVLEDIVNSRQRPKFEEVHNQVFFALKQIGLGSDPVGIESHQVSVVFGSNWVMSFQESGASRLFDAVRDRIKRTVPRDRFMASDYLAYALADAIVDGYFGILETTGEQIEDLDEAISDHPLPEHLEGIRNLKRRLIVLRRAVSPVREVVGGFIRGESALIHDRIQPYVRDLNEHVVQVNDIVESYRDMVNGLLDLYHTGVASRMNDIMKFLTIFATIFIPLGFLAGVYGMNFDTAVSPFNLPELGFRYGYLLFWGLASAIALGLLAYFRRRSWL